MFDSPQIQQEPIQSQQTDTYQTQDDSECKDSEPVLENDMKIITKVEKLTNQKQIIKIKNKIKEFSLTEKVEKYIPHFQYPLSDPVPIEISKATQEPYSCKQIDENKDQKSNFFLCKYQMIGKRTLSEYIKEQPNIQRILDQHDQLLKAMATLSEEKKMIHYAIKNNTIIVKDTDDIPVVTNFKEAAFLYYEQELNMDNFDKIIPLASDIHCIEAHILIYLGKKKQPNQDINQWKTQKYDQSQHTEATQQHIQGQQSYPEYIDKTYEEVYQQITKTFSKWDIYSITKMFSDILREIEPENDQENQELLKNYQANLTELLSKKTIELTDTVPKIQQPPEQQTPEQQTPEQQTPEQQTPEQQPPQYQSTM